jgi:DNA-binding transcriptional ArsR family regulator
MRQEILQQMHREGRMSVTFLYKEMRIEQSIASQHLAILRKAGLVLSERNGKHKFYSVNYQQVKRLHQIADILLETRA